MINCEDYVSESCYGKFQHFDSKQKLSLISKIYYETGGY